MIEHITSVASSSSGSVTPRQQTRSGGAVLSRLSSSASSAAIFDRFDINEDGVVSLQELIAGMAAEAAAAKEALAATSTAAARDMSRMPIQLSARYTQAGLTDTAAVGTTVDSIA